MSNRSKAILDIVEHMDALIDQRSALQRQIRSLKKSVKRELDIKPESFDLALRLRSISRKEASGRYLGDICEVSAALGIILPGPEITEHITGKSLSDQVGVDLLPTITSNIINALKGARRPIKSTELVEITGEKDGTVRGVLHRMKVKGLVVHHSETKEWSA